MQFVIPWLPLNCYFKVAVLSKENAHIMMNSVEYSERIKLGVLPKGRSELVVRRAIKMDTRSLLAVIIRDYTIRKCTRHFGDFVLKTGNIHIIRLVLNKYPELVLDYINSGKWFNDLRLGYIGIIRLLCKTYNLVVGTVPVIPFNILCRANYEIITKLHEFANFEITYNELMKVSFSVGSELDILNILASNFEVTLQDEIVINLCKIKPTIWNKPLYNFISKCKHNKSLVNSYTARYIAVYCNFKYIDDYPGKVSFSGGDLLHAINTNNEILLYNILGYQVFTSGVIVEIAYKYIMLQGTDIYQHQMFLLEFILLNCEGVGLHQLLRLMFVCIKYQWAIVVVLTVVKTKKYYPCEIPQSIITKAREYGHNIFLDLI